MQINFIHRPTLTRFENGALAFNPEVINVTQISQEQYCGLFDALVPMYYTGSSAMYSEVRGFGGRLPLRMILIEKNGLFFMGLATLLQYSTLFSPVAL